MYLQYAGFGRSLTIMADDVWDLALERIERWLENWYEARVRSMPKDADRRHSYCVPLLERELSSRDQIDHICRGWIEGRPIQMKRLPRRDPDICALLYDRFAEAHGFALKCRGKAPVVVSTVDGALTFLLVDHWADGGADSWRECVDE